MRILIKQRFQAFDFCQCGVLLPQSRSLPIPRLLFFQQRRYFSLTLFVQLFLNRAWLFETSILINNINLALYDNNKTNQLSRLALCIQGQCPWLPFSVLAGIRSETEDLIYGTSSFCLNTRVANHGGSKDTRVNAVRLSTLH